ncbi:MAG: acyl--CoA ligase family protein [Dehalococcoidia bacterium]|nr:Long-chain-fatty-acid--CoA ligase [Chloroflexota bacterium]MBT9161136.1 Long-chain-fatty-acid--CoA ligase [Chloroflexota bacterium]MBT9162317.1 Long-chain-fatty-acid--CoA ligase [Chloroflexota bacterium]
MKNEVYYTPLTPVNFLLRSAAVFPTKTAIIHKDKRFTYQEFYDRVNKLASALQNAGIEKGDRIAFLSPNIPPLLDAHYGVPLAGAVLVAINIRLSPREILYILNHSGSKLLCVDTGFANLIEPIRKELETIERFILIDDGEGAAELEGTEYEEFLNTGSKEPLEVPVEDDYETISINYTSGTTGVPKGVMYHHRGAYLNALGEALQMKMSSYSNYLWTLPMFHCNGWCFTWGVTAVGGTHVCLRAVDADRIFDLIETEKVSHFCAAPIVLITLAGNPRSENLNLEHKLHIVVAGAPPSPTIIQKMEDMGAEITHVYGLTETYGPHSICEWQPQWDNLKAKEKALIKARQGVPYIHALEMRVVNDNMEDVPRDGQTMGEIVMRGNNVMMGYYLQEEATAEAFRGGWFHSDDLAIMHENGYVEIKDRKKDLIISGGENISTVELENVIYKHPDVQEVSVVAIPHEKWGEVPKAFVVAKPGTNPAEEDIIEFCRQHLARFKCPKAVEFGELPKTSTGKIQKYILRDKEWKGYDKKVN